MNLPEQWHRIVKDKDSYYKSYTVPKKSGGMRLIENPAKELKEVQREILDKILSHIKIDGAAHGFVENRGIFTNAAHHVGKVCVVNLDLKDFFHTVITDRIIKELSRFVKTPQAITELCTYKGRLPMGSPASPCISNIVSVILDRKLGALARKHDAVYTRYADDITFSSKTNKTLPNLIPKAHSFIKGEGFELNYKKIQIMRTGSKQIVTGLVVNEKVNVPRARVRNFRAEVHQFKDLEDFQELNRLRGFWSFVVGANKAKGAWFKSRLFKCR
ncbi:MAG: hypothetical protein DRP42_04255 [Tenericutes bacterium]|nr:MAG: hypothetical protein DRP42_04255 [Mycoplasmatota bacterium]